MTTSETIRVVCACITIVANLVTIGCVLYVLSTWRRK